MKSPYLCTDATGVLVQGYLVADAHAVYDHLYADGRVVEVGCMAHCRRYYFKAMSSDPERARYALAIIGELFRIERRLAGKPHRKKLAERRKHSKPLVDKLFEWCDAQVDLVLDDTPIAKAIGYSRNQRVALRRFIEDGRLPLHNNGSELQLGRQAIGRKNWLFVGSDDGGRNNARFVSLLASCQLHHIEPWAYLRDLLCLLPEWPAHRASSSPPRTGTRPSSRTTLSSGSPPTSSAASRSGRSRNIGTRCSTRPRRSGHAVRRTDTAKSRTSASGPSPAPLTSDRCWADLAGGRMQRLDEGGCTRCS